MDVSLLLTKEIYYYADIVKKLFVKVVLNNVKCVANSIVVYAR